MRSDEVQGRSDDHEARDLLSKLLLTGEPETDPSPHGASHEDVVSRAESLQDSAGVVDPVSKLYSLQRPFGVAQ